MYFIAMLILEIFPAAGGIRTFDVIQEDLCSRV